MKSDANKLLTSEFVYHIPDVKKMINKESKMKIKYEAVFGGWL